MDCHGLRQRHPALLIALSRATWLLLLACLALPAPAIARESNREKLLKLLKRRPRSMTVDTWREQRREAARELGRQKEKRAVPLLLKIVNKERFDVILEIAIDALGNIGDKRAVPPLKKLLNDPSLDAYVRDAIAGALKKLGAKTSVKPVRPVKPLRPVKPVKPVKPLKPVTPIKPSPPKTRRGFAALPSLKLPKIPVDMIAQTDRFEIIAGGGEVSYHSVSERAKVGIGFGTRYLRKVERKAFGYTIDGLTDLGFRLDDPPGDNNVSWDLSHRLQVNPEIRYYPFQRDLPQLFGQAIGGFGYGLELARPAIALENRLSFAGTISVGGGPGYGRVYDVGPRLRLRRLERVLRGAKLLTGKQIDPDTARRLSQAWHHLRSRIGNYSQLGYTLRILREADLVQEDVDPATVYRLLRILDDPQLFNRPSGMLFRLGYGYARTLVKDGTDDDFGFLFATAETYFQLRTTKELHAQLRFFFNHITDPNTFAVNLQATFNWYLYSRAFDPLGAIGATISAGVNNQLGFPVGDNGVGYQVLAGASYTRFFDRGTRVVASLRGGGDHHGGLLMFSVEAHFGFTAGSLLAKF